MEAQSEERPSFTSFWRKTKDESTARELTFVQSDPSQSSSKGVWEFHVYECCYCSSYKSKAIRSAVTSRTGPRNLGNLQRDTLSRFGDQDLSTLRSERPNSRRQAWSLEICVGLSRALAAYVLGTHCYIKPLSAPQLF